jgi:glycosyltransferase involved in cell wall biosynthesis
MHMKNHNVKYLKLRKGKPRVSIGLPVFNGEKYLEETLDSILAQTYLDFELIISDNASTDCTQQICRDYASKDIRIRYHRNEKNLGASQNFNLVFKMSSGEYFKWAAYDDLLAPDFLFKCVNVLDNDPSIVLCASETGCIDEQGANIGDYVWDNSIVNSEKPHKRFGYIICERHPTWLLIFGLIRADSLRRTSLFGNYIGADRNLVAEISLIDRLYVIPEYLFFRRAHAEAYTENVESDYQEGLSWWTKERRVNFPFVRILIEYLCSVRSCPMRWFERQLCYAQVLSWFITEGGVSIGINVGNNLLGNTRARHMLYRVANRIRRFKV